MHVGVCQQVFWIMILEILHTQTGECCEVCLTFNPRVRFFMRVVWEGNVHSTLESWALKEHIFLMLLSRCRSCSTPIFYLSLSLYPLMHAGACWSFPVQIKDIGG